DRPLVNVAPLRTVGSHDPVSPVLPHDLDAVYCSSLPSVTRRNERQVGQTPQTVIGHRHLPFPQSSSASRVTAGDDVAEVGGLGFAGVWVKHSPPKRLRNASAVAVSGKQNRI